MPDWINDIGQVRFMDEYNNYLMILYPYKHIGESPTDQEPCGGNLTEDLDDITKDLRQGLILYERGEVKRAIDCWRSNFFVHWGKFHASQALYVMQHLLADDHMNYRIVYESEE